jgi:hypothetical protein
MVGLIIVLWLACGVGGYFIGKTKDRAGQGVALGLILGVLGLIIISLMKEKWR